MTKKSQELMTALTLFGIAAKYLQNTMTDYQHEDLAWPEERGDVGQPNEAGLYPFSASLDELRIESWVTETQEQIRRTAYDFKNEQLYKDFTEGKYYCDLSTKYAATVIHDIIGGTMILCIAYHNGSGWEKVASYAGYTEQDDVTGDIELLEHCGVELEGMDAITSLTNIKIK